MARLTSHQTAAILAPDMEVSRGVRLIYYDTAD
ncbi:hypothetical protein KOR42_34340 [Thalassoglobus neptunius]|uniref:Uncharacterized protein n=1 Tax=Thalassoglobus neptunius TaxID=1938619 RepID=A0A5C5WMA1_9PLAN|nr:hypothetical protein KOR42_34340 [Thalassoglobus neptunius]